MKHAMDSCSDVTVGSSLHTVIKVSLAKYRACNPMMSTEQSRKQVAVVACYTHIGGVWATLIDQQSLAVSEEWMPGRTTVQVTTVGTVSE